jgi:DNA-binding NarL/FixJ family response regulator
MYIDAYPVTRDYIARELSVHLPGIAIDSIDTMAELATLETAARFELAILHTHTARVGEAGTAAQLSLLTRLAPRLPLVLLSDIDEVDAIIEAIRVGARGYITTRQSMLDAAKVVHFVSAGGVAGPGNVLAEERPDSAAEPRAARASLPVKFTRRQLDVLTRLWQGKSNKAIAFELGMSESTVKTHIQGIMQKLGAANRTQVVLMTRPLCEGRKL